MSSGLNEGIANELVVQAEAGFLGAGTGPAYSVAGKVGFSHNPVLSGTSSRRGLYRMADGDSFSARTFRCSLDLEYPGSESFALILASLLRRTGSSPSYSFGRPTSFRPSFLVSLKYNPNNYAVVFRGCLADEVQLAIRPRGVVTCKVGIAAAVAANASPVAATVQEAHLPAPGWSGSVYYGGVSSTRAYEVDVTVKGKVSFENFGEGGEPAAFVPDGGVDFSANVSEWVADDSSADAVPAAGRTMAEAAQRFDCVPAPGKILRFDFPRSIVRSGTPPGFQKAGLAYRFGTEAQAGERSADFPTVTMNL